eukprot:jgi/Psemu1/325439/estExt_fgenesh1_pg.C_2410003
MVTGSKGEQRFWDTDTATIQQVLAEACKENQEIPWELPRRNNANVLIEANEVAEYLTSKRGNSHGSGTRGAATTAGTPKKQSSLSASSWLMSPLKVVSAVASMMRDPDDDVDEWIQDGDDALLDDGSGGGGDAGQSSTSSSSSSLSNTIIGLKIPIANVIATEAAIQCIEHEIQNIAPDMPYVLGLSEWNAWAHSAVSKHHHHHHHANKNKNKNKNHKLSVHDNDFLLRVLIGLNKACVIQRHNKSQKGLDVLVLSSTEIDRSDCKADNCIPERLRIPVSLWDIEKAEAQIEQNLQDWSNRAAACTEKALAYKKQKQIELAKIQLTKRRVIQQRIDSDSRLQIQLLQTRNAIETAQSNRSMVDIMANSAKLLKQLREETPLEEVDETIDDLQSECDDMQDVHNALSSLGSNALVMDKDEEEELLKELEGLSITSATVDVENETNSKQEIEAGNERLTGMINTVSEETVESTETSHDPLPESAERIPEHA